MRTPLRRAAIVVALLAAAGGPTGIVFAQSDETAPAALESPYEGAIVSRIEVTGLERVDSNWIVNNINTSEGRPLVSRVLEQDLRQLQRLDQFEDVQVSYEALSDGTVVVRIAVVEAPVITDVSVVGNREVADEVLAAAINLFADAPIDEYQIGRATRAIEKLYRERGYYQVQVLVDESELRSEGKLLFRIREGPRVQVTAIRFDGNSAFGVRELRPEIETKTRGIFGGAPLDEEVLRGDVSSLVRFYLDRGYLDVRADREIQISRDGREAIVTFIVDEGRLYTLRDVRARARGTEDEEPSVFSSMQLAGLIEIKSGDVYSLDRLRASEKTVEDAYRELGYLDVNVRRLELRDTRAPVVDLLFEIDEGLRYKVGRVRIEGNTVTKQNVIRRQIDLLPARPFHGTRLDESSKELQYLKLFKLGSIKLTPQPPADYDAQYRDLLVEVADTDTGRIQFGAIASSDSGLSGAISLRQDNFDLYDVPGGVGELFRGESFRGAGQSFVAEVQPGTRVSRYSVSLTEPYLFESPYSLGGSGYFRDREFSNYDEERYGGRLRLARRFGTRWTGGLALRAESISLSDLDRGAPVDVYAVEDQNIITSIGLDLQRTSVDNRFRPTRGSRIELLVEQVGLLGGDFDFTRLNAEAQLFVTIDEDFFGRKTVLALKTDVGYIPQEDEAPVYERFYLGGRSFRGFDFRGIGPLGVKRNGNLSDDHVGGDFKFFFGVEVERPVWKDTVAIVGFVDTGTINDDFGFDDYRVAIGTGIRLYLPFFGQAPLAFDFGFPVVDENTDDDRIFSFSFDLPF